MKEKFDGKWKIIIVFSALFLVIAILLILIFNAGKKSYTVQFDLDGGTLISGSLEQTVTHGEDARLPVAVKDGAYLHSWSASHQRITKDTVIRAIWEYETTPGIRYTDSENQNYTEIEGAFPYLQGEVYIGAYQDKKMVLSILDGAFFNCKGITKVYLLDGLLSIGDNAFAGCTSLTEIAIPETVVHLGNGVFRGCDSLETLILQEPEETDKDKDKDNDKDKDKDKDKDTHEVEKDKTQLKEIGEDAFFGCTSLTEVIIPESVVSLGQNAFRGCESLKKVVLSDGITEIGFGTFLGCESLTEIKLPKSLVRIGEGAFRGCESLETIVLPEGLEEIGANAFAGCTALKTVILPESLKKIDVDAFAGCDDLVILTAASESEAPVGWEVGWNGSAKVEWEAEIPETAPVEDPEKDSKEDEVTVG